MNDKFLQTALKTGLFDIGDSDERLKWLQQSIDELQKKLEENISLLPKYTLVGLDPNIPEAEPTLTQTELIVTAHWKALRGKYVEMPRNILRGVILNSLYNLGNVSPTAARVIYLTALNFYPYAKLNNERDLINIMLNDLGNIAEQNAIAEWSLLEEKPSIKLSTLKVGGLKFDAVKIDEESVRQKWQEALSSDPQSGHGPQHGLQDSRYKTYFISKATEAVSNSMNSALEKLSKSVSSIEIEGPVNKFFADFKKNLESSLKTSFTSLTAVERRSKLLWWKETLYSPSLKKSYRGLNKYLLPIIMGSDLNSQLPDITPISTDYLLRDTLFLLNDKREDVVTFSEYMASISKVELKTILKPYFPLINESEGRISITDYMGLVINDKATAKDIYNKTGINENENISLGELSVAVLHDLLTHRLISE